MTPLFHIIYDANSGVTPLPPKSHNVSSGVISHFTTLLKMESAG
jgi:hypothetical protein